MKSEIYITWKVGTVVVAGLMLMIGASFKYADNGIAQVRHEVKLAADDNYARHGDLKNRDAEIIDSMARMEVKIDDLTDILNYMSHDSKWRLGQIAKAMEDVKKSTTKIPKLMSPAPHVITVPKETVIKEIFITEPAAKEPPRDKPIELRESPRQ